MEETLIKEKGVGHQLSKTYPWPNNVSVYRTKSTVYNINNYPFHTSESMSMYISYGHMSYVI